MDEQPVHDLDRLLRVVDGDVDVHPEDQLAAGDVLQLIDQLPVAVLGRDPLALEQAEGVRPGGADPEPLVARDPADVAAQLAELGVDVGGLLALLAYRLVAATGGNLAHAGYAILWASAFLSAFVDNIPFVATLIPLIKSMAPAYGGADKIEPLWWCLSLGACLGGNGTLIGASANLTVAGIGDRNKVPFSFITYTLYAFPMMVVSVAICHVYVWWRYF